MVPNFTFAFGYMIMSLFSYLIPEWRPLTFLLAALTFPFLLTWWLWPESPRWLYSVGKYKEAEETIMIFAKKLNADLNNFEPEETLLKDESHDFRKYDK